MCFEVRFFYETKAERKFDKMTRSKYLFIKSIALNNFLNGGHIFINDI